MNLKALKTMLFGAVLACLLAIPASPQSGQPAQANTGPLSTWLRGPFTGNRNYLARAADAMPEEFYSMRPGPQMEVRTFGQIVGHLANYNYQWCADARGEKNPNTDTDFEKVTTKSGLVKGLNDALAYCDGVYAWLTDANALDTIASRTEGGREIQLPRVGRLIQNVLHNNDHYGNLVTYMRIKGLVPPSSAPTPQAAAPAQGM